MHAILRSPVLWPRVGELCVLTPACRLSQYERALLYRLGKLTFSYPLSHGDPMHYDVSSAVRLVTPATEQPVTLTVAKQFLRIEHTAEDDAISLAIAAATESAQQYLGTALLPQSWELIIPSPASAQTLLPVCPASSITTVHSINSAGTQTLLSTDAYMLSRDGRSVCWKEIPGAEAVKILYVAGAYADAVSIPAPIVQGILHHVAAILEQRDGKAGMPARARDSYATFRQVRV